MKTCIKELAELKSAILMSTFVHEVNVLGVGGRVAGRGKGKQKGMIHEYMIFALLWNKSHLSFLAEVWAKENTGENTIKNVFMFQPLIGLVAVLPPFLQSIFSLTSSYRSLPLQLEVPPPLHYHLKCNCETFKWTNGFLLKATLPKTCMESCFRKQYPKVF